MPRNNAQAKRARRALAADAGISYTAAFFADPHRVAPRFADKDFHTASQAGEAPAGTRHVQVARGNGYVQMRAGADPAVITFTTEQFDRYQLGARRGHPTGTPLFVVTREDDWRFLNAEDPDGVIRTDPHGHSCFLDGVFRGEFGGPESGRTEGLSSGRAMTARTYPIAAYAEIGPDDAALTCARKTWAALAPLIAATPVMRQFDSRGRLTRRAPLTTDLPTAPTAVPVYRNRTTRLLALDFDGPQGEDLPRIDADVRQMMRWTYECGGEVITDRSTTGFGRHVLVPLSADVACAELAPILQSLAKLLPTLDIAVMLNDTYGAIIPPGSRTTAGGYRVLDCSIGAAIEALNTRCAAGFLDRLTLLTCVFTD
ncbi:hypothetical protein [Nocardia pseudovaccinii]|uniref:hypothetical protein n=1 Tax=Nocardia pseudovaccinii TaxID=189540 RepID=UPI000AE3BFDC|nr:hypothetical protein [Nocardia pseudovaccinii]